VPPDRLSILVCDRKIPAMAETWPTVATALAELGHDVQLNADEPVELTRYDVVLLNGNPGYFPRMEALLRAAPRRPLVAVYHAEPLPPPRRSGLPRWSPLSPSELGKIVLRDWRATDIYSNASTLRRMAREGLIDLLFVTSLEKQEYLAERGVASTYVPYGYHPSFGTILGLERRIDVLFLGDRRPWRRKRQLRYLRRHGVDVDARGSWYDPSLWGESRSRLLNQVKIVVHLQRYPGKIAAKRLVLALANGALVIAEPSYRPDPFVPGTHFVMAPVREMPDLIRHYLAHPDERERIVAAGHRLVTEELTFERSARTMVELMQERLAELGASEPAPSLRV
jgi:hypothetical protein